MGLRPFQASESRSYGHDLGPEASGVSASFTTCPGSGAHAPAVGTRYTFRPPTVSGMPAGWAAGL
jgi:hypothetical protein